MSSYFRKVVQIFELKRVGGAPKGHQFTSLNEWQGKKWKVELFFEFWLHPIFGKITNFIVNDEKRYWEIDSALSIGVNMD